MNLPPVLAALRKHKSGVVLIVLQIALTLAIVCNAVFVIGQRVQRVDRPTGMNEKNLFVIGQMYVHAPTGHGAASIAKLDAMQRADLATLRNLPDVESVASINTMPLLESNVNIGGVMLKPAQKRETTRAAFYSGGDEVVRTLGLRLIAGRNFSPDEVTATQPDSNAEPPVALVTKSLAGELFPNGRALGRVIYINGNRTPTTIIGIVARLQTPDADSKSGKRALASVLLPVRADSSYTHYAVRAKPGRMDAAMRDAHKALMAVNPMRVVRNGFDGFVGIYPYSEIRARAYRADVGMAILMGVISVILLAVTGAGIVGLTSFWVGQRRKQIGVRRALGATRRNIIHYFQIENLIIAGGGVVLGALLAVGLNLALMQQFQMARMPLGYVLVGIVVLLVLGQAAVFAPALRASHVSPAEATRSV